MGSSEEHGSLEQVQGLAPDTCHGPGPPAFLLIREADVTGALLCRYHPETLALCPLCIYAPASQLSKPPGLPRDGSLQAQRLQINAN